MWLGISLGSIMLYLWRSHTSSVSEFCGGGWSEVRYGLFMLLKCMSHNHCNLFEVMWVQVWSKIRAFWSCICILVV